MFFPQALHFLVQVFVLDLLLLPLRAVICPDPGVERVCIHAQVTSGLGNGLIRLDRQFHRAFFGMQRDIFSSGVGSSNTPRLLRYVLGSVYPGEYSHITLPSRGHVWGTVIEEQNRG